MNFVFLMNPLESVIIKKDTTFILMLEAYKRKHKIFFLPAGGIIRKNGSIYFDVIEVKPQKNKIKPFIKIRSLILNQNKVNVIFIRTDPPFNAEYLLNTWLLDLLPRKILVVNRPSSVRSVNEKIWATQFSSIVPKTLVSSNKNSIIKFICENDKVVLKPTDGYGGESVFKINKNDSNMNVIIETMTNNYSKHIIVQQFIQKAESGDKRILLLSGEPIGAVKRIHHMNDHRNNLFVGGKAVKTDINKRDLEIIAILKPKLLELGLYFVGIDIIGKYLIEVNITSPTCVQEINRIYKVKLEKQIINFIEREIKCKI